MTYFDCCCDGWCVARYDDCTDKLCPCVSYDGRECIANCCFALLVLGLVLGLIVSIPVVLIGGLAVVHGVSVTAEEASLSTFALATTSTTPAAAAAVVLAYNLSMTVSVHNPNWFLGVDFTTPLQAGYSFDGSRLGHAWLAGAGEKLPAGKTQVYHVATGVVEESDPLGVDGVTEFVRQKLSSAAGVFEVDVLVAGHYTLRGAKRSLAATCALKLPLGAPPAASQKVKCV